MLPSYHSTCSPPHLSSPLVGRTRDDRRGTEVKLWPHVPGGHPLSESSSGLETPCPRKIRKARRSLILSPDLPQPFQPVAFAEERVFVHPFPLARPSDPFDVTPPTLGIYLTKASLDASYQRFPLDQPTLLAALLHRTRLLIVCALTNNLHSFIYYSIEDRPSIGLIDCSSSWDCCDDDDITAGS